MNRLNFANEQLMMEMGDGPLSIRQLAEQTFRMKEESHKENAMRKQHDSVLFKRSLDPTISHNRKKTPLQAISTMTKDGLIGGTLVGDAQKAIMLNKASDEEEEQEATEAEVATSVVDEEKEKAEDEEEGSNHTTWIIVGSILIISAIFLALLSSPERKTTTQRTR